MNTHVTRHAADRYYKRWAPELPRYESDSELRGIVSGLMPTKRPAIAGGEIWAGIRARDGEQILCVVKREGHERIVVTVLDRTARERKVANDRSDLDEIVAAHEEDMRELRSRRSPDPMPFVPKDERDRDRVRTARDLIRRWREGFHVKSEKLKHACWIAGESFSALKEERDRKEGKKAG